MKPDQYILNEWESMCEKASKSLQGNCPLLEDEVLVKMHQYIGSLKKIAQEVVRDISKRSYRDSFCDEPIVEINEKLDKLLNEMDELSCGNFMDNSSNRDLRIGWQPIETAPKDGTWVLLCGGNINYGWVGGDQPPCVVGQYTNNFRWALAPKGSVGFFMYGGVENGTHYAQFLQQAWECVEDGEIEWRFLPVVELNT